MVVSAFGGPTLMVALASTLSLMGFASVALLRVATSRLEVTVEPLGLRTFKQESASAVLSITTRSSTWARLCAPSIAAPYGLACETRQLGAGRLEVAVRPLFAGKFTGLRVGSELEDALGLVRRTERAAAADLTVESLPRSLLRPQAKVAVSPLASGEVPAGRRGLGQELYAVEEYQRGLDARDILWRRVASAPDDKIHSRVREANIKAVVKIAVAVGWATEEERVARHDLVSEAIGSIGGLLLAAGTAVEVSYMAENGVSSTLASNLEELPSVTIAPSNAVQPPLELLSLVIGADLVIFGPTVSPSLLDGLGRSRALIVSEGSRPPPGTGALNWFTGQEDMSNTARELLEG